MAEGEAGKDRRKREFREAVLRAEDEAIERALRGSVEDAFAATCPACGHAREASDEACLECGSTKPAAYVHDLKDRVSAARFILPHRYPKEFSTRAEVQATGPDGGPVQVQAEVAVRPLFSDEQLAAMTPEQLQAALAGFGAAVTGGGS